MTRFYDIDDANAALPDLDGILTTLAEQRAELIRLRDQVTADDKPEAEELRRVRLRMQGLVDQMAAGVARIEELGVTLRDIPRRARSTSPRWSTAGRSGCAGGAARRTSGTGIRSTPASPTAGR